MSGRHLAFPFRIGSDGRTLAPADLDAHVKGELVQLLLTNPGERPFLPDFGGGLRRLVFEGNSEVTAAVAKATITDSLSHWLADRLEIMALEVENQQATLRVGLRYRVKESGEERQVVFQHEGSPP
jgi:uncharacterized protein